MFYIEARGTVYYCNEQVYNHIWEKHGCLENALNYDLDHKTMSSYFKSSIRFEMLVTYCSHFGTVKYDGNGQYIYIFLHV